jgi:hypothetical protein
MFGGVVWVPSALRRMLNTMTIRVNAVIITSRLGASERMPIPTTIWTSFEVSPGSGVPLLLPRSRLTDCADALLVSAKKRIKATTKRRKKT